MIITQDSLIKQIAIREDLDVATVRGIFKATEDIIFDHLSSVPPSDDMVIKLMSGLTIERKYAKEKLYSKGMFRNIRCLEHTRLKASLSKYFKKKVNDEIIIKQLLNKG